MGSKADNPKKRRLRDTQNTVSIVNVETPDADQRLVKALQMLLDEKSSSISTIHEDLKAIDTKKEQKKCSNE